MPKKELKITVEAESEKYGISSIRYAAYAMSGSAYVFLTPMTGSKVRVEFSPKPGAGEGFRSLPAAFRRELEDEKLRARVAGENAQLREFLLAKALNYSPKPPAEQDAGLTPQQEKELNDLISQIETEIKRDTASSKGKTDPLGITNTWEEKYGPKAKKRKKR